MYNINLKKAKKNFKTDVNGEVCETVLEIGILEFMKRYPKACKEWVLKKGLIVKDIDDPNNGFLTEIDLVLATPQMIYLFECKCRHSLFIYIFAYINIVSYYKSN